MSSKCGICEEVMTEEAHCSACNKDLHFHCGGIQELGYRKLGIERKLTWRCQRCKQAGLHSQPPTVTPTHDPAPSSCDYTTLLREIRAISMRLDPLDSLIDDVKALRNEFSDLKTSVEASNNAIKEFSSKINGIEQRLLQLENAKKDQANLIQAQLHKIENNIQEKEQWDRMNNIEIKGVTQSKNENLIDLLIDIGKKIQYPIAKSQINFVTRVQSRDPNHTKPIIACFNNRYVKEDFIAAARTAAKTSPLTPSALGLQGQQRVYVNDHLTLQNKSLLTKAKQVGKDMGFQYIWVKHSKIFARRDDLSPIINIKSEKDLSKITK